MASTALSQSPYLPIVAGFLGTVSLGIGITVIFNPASAIGVFQLPVPKTQADQNVVKAFVTVYAVRDVFMAVSVCASVWYDERRIMGLMLIATGAMAFADGIIARTYAGKGEWSHWAVTPVLVGVGCVALGLLDG